MTSRDFCYWLQGWFELNSTTNNKEITPATMEMIKAHLGMVFAHEIDPTHGDKEMQEKLNEIHNRPTLQELLPDHKVHSGFPENDEKWNSKPSDWNMNWEYDNFHGWYNPLQGKPRC